MRQEAAKIDRRLIERANGYAKERVAYTLERARMYSEDPERAYRLKVSECVVCYRSGRQGGTVTTERPCPLCGAIILSGNTNIDILCAKCAVENQLCKHCGADVDLKSRRKARPYEEARISLDNMTKPY